MGQEDERNKDLLELAELIRRREELRVEREQLENKTSTNKLREIKDFFSGGFLKVLFKIIGSIVLFGGWIWLETITFVFLFNSFVAIPFEINQIHFVQAMGISLLIDFLTIWNAKKEEEKDVGIFVKAITYIIITASILGFGHILFLFM